MGGVVLGYCAAIGLPLVVIAWVLLWPERTPKDRTVSAIRQCIEEEDGSPPAR
jgi:hypothetical protein